MILSRWATEVKLFSFEFELKLAKLSPLRMKVPEKLFMHVTKVFPRVKTLGMLSGEVIKVLISQLLLLLTKVFMYIALSY